MSYIPLFADRRCALPGSIESGTTASSRQVGAFNYIYIYIKFHYKNEHQLLFWLPNYGESLTCMPIPGFVDLAIHALTNLRDNIKDVDTALAPVTCCSFVHLP